MIPEFLNRSKKILGKSGYEILKNAKISIAGLGGVGGLTFLMLVRSGIENFKIAENDIFDIADFNRQILANNKNIGKPKLDEYVEFAENINPEIKIEVFENGIDVDNISEFMYDSELLIRVIDYQIKPPVKLLIEDLISEMKIPMFQAMTIWTSAILHNYKPGGCTPSRFVYLFEKNLEVLNPLIFTGTYSHMSPKKLLTMRESYPASSLCVSANMASTLLATEVLRYLLSQYGIVNKKPIFTPKFVLMNLFEMSLHYIDLESL